MKKPRITAAFAIVISCIAIATLSQSRISAEEKKKDPAVERARKQVEMLDGIYKNAIVLVTEHYVTEESDLPAGTAFKKLFEITKAKGWCETRLLDATGEPYNDENVANDAFEKKAIKQLVGGKAYYDEVIEKDGKRYLRAATAVPVVMKKCVMCHDNYADVPKGKAIGALGYIVPIE
jgi:hypothetical protein